MMLKPSSSKHKEMKICTFDIEAFNWIDFQMLGFYDGNKYYHFDSVEDFMNHFITRKYAGYHCFAHNFGGYDFNFIMDYIIKNKNKYNCKAVPIGSNIGFLSVKKNNHKKRTWHFNDSYLLLKHSLDDLTKTFNVQHKKMDMDRNNLEKYDRNKVAEYMKYDTIGLYEVLIKFKEWIGKYKVPIQPTIAKQSLEMWKKTLRRPVICLSDDAEEFVRKAYHGGRNEIFKMKTYDNVYTYDFNSLYPSIMLDSLMPTGKPVYTKVYKDDSLGFFKAKIKIPDMYIPPLPIHRNMKLIYPVGIIEGVYSTNELNYAIDLGCEVDVEEGYTFSSDYIFKEYIEHLYGLKVNAKDKVTKLIAKLLMNSLYGKFAQKRIQEYIIYKSGFKEPKDFNSLIFWKPELSLFKKEKHSNANFIIPSLSATITANAGIKLHKAFKKLKEQNIYYTDTDSIITTKRMKTSNKIGELKEEMNGDGAIFLLPKLYAIKMGDEVKIKAKGFDSSVLEKLSFSDFEDALNGDYSAFKQSKIKFAKFKTSIIRNDQALSMAEFSKSIQSKYNKRNILRSFDTEPIKVIE